MTIKAIKPIIIKPERVVTPQCCVKVDDPSHNKSWRAQHYTKIRPEFDSAYCQRESSFIIDGKNYCRPHAGQVTLEMFCDGRLIEAEK